MSTSYSCCVDPSEDERYRCRHVFIDGHRCASPCLRQQEFCYYHHTTRRPVRKAAQRKARVGSFALNAADLADRSGILYAIAQVLERIAANDLDPRRAGLLLYGLQTAVIALPKPRPKDEPPLLVDDVAEDPQLGTLAPREQIRNLVNKKDTLAELLKKLERNKPVEDPEAATRWASPADIEYNRYPQNSSTPPNNILPEVKAVADTGTPVGRRHRAAHRLPQSRRRPRATASNRQLRSAKQCSLLLAELPAPQLFLQNEQICTSHVRHLLHSGDGDQRLLAGT